MYNDDMKINRTLKKIMIDENTGLHQMALRSKRSRQTISDTLNTSTNPTISTIEAIANALNHDIRVQFIRRRDGKIIDCD